LKNLSKNKTLQLLVAIVGGAMFGWYAWKVFILAIEWAFSIQITNPDMDSLQFGVPVGVAVSLVIWLIQKQRTISTPED